MKSFKPLLLVIAGLFIITLMIPALLVAPFNQSTKGQLGEQIQKEEVQAEIPESDVSVPVYRDNNKQIEDIPLEEYVVGVVASEMPAEFEKEALKAQALAARTYIVKQMMSGNPIGVPEGALVSDTVMHQVFKSDKELRNQWGSDYEWKMAKITEAVAGTAGQILTYDNQPIEASFFSTSNGYTENSEAYWENAVPYLKAVPSPWDEKSDKYLNRKVVSIQDFEKTLGVNLKNGESIGKIIERTPGKRVGTVEIDGKKFSGREIREKLDLKSTDFTWTIKGDDVVITTKGYGHGVGMSQYGANFMAQDGKTFDEIVTYYYNGAQIKAAEQYLTKYTAQN